MCNCNSCKFMEQSNFIDVPNVDTSQQKKFSEIATDIGAGIGGFTGSIIGGVVKPLQTKTTVQKTEGNTPTPGTNTTNVADDKRKTAIFVGIALVVVTILVAFLLFNKNKKS